MEVNIVRELFQQRREEHTPILTQPISPEVQT